MVSGCIKPDISVDMVKKPTTTIPIPVAPPIDPSLPTVTINQAILETIGSCNFLNQKDPTNTAGIEFKIHFSESIDTGTFDVSDILNTGTGGGTAVTWNLQNCGDNRYFKLTATAVVGEGTIRPRIAENSLMSVAGKENNASTSTDNSVLYDSIRPSLTIGQHPTQLDPTGGAPVKFSVQFSEAIDTSTFTVFDVVLDGTSTTTVSSWLITNSGDNQNFILEAMSVGGNGTIIPIISANSIRDLAGNFNTSAVPLADNAVTINSSMIAPPTIEQQMGVNAATNSLPIEFNVYFNLPVNQATFTTSDITQTGTSTGVTWTIINTGDDQNFRLIANTASANGTVIPSIASNAVSSVSSGNFPASVAVGTGATVRYDTIAPTVVISQEPTQEDPTASTPVRFRAIFSEPIDVTTFTPADLYLNSSSSGVVTTWSIVNTGDDRTFRLEATAVGTPGTIIPNMQAGKVFDKAQNSNALPTYGADNTVTFDNSSPRVTINQHPGGVVGSCPNVTTQVDPTNNPVIGYLVNFNKIINAGTFTTADITNIGTGGSGGITWSLTTCGDNRNFLLRTTAVNGAGTIIPRVNAGLVQDSLGNLNAVSTSSDGSVLYSSLTINVAVNQHPGGVIGSCPNINTQVDPVTNTDPINYLVTFSSAINPTSFTVADIVNTGSGGSTQLTWNLTSCGDNTNFLLSTNTIVGDGTIVPTINSNTVSDVAGNINVQSTATDNSVLIDVKGPAISLEKYPGGTTASCALIPVQSDPSRTLSLKYLVKFDEPIQPDTFDRSDITNVGSGGTGYLDWRLTNCGDDRNYLLEAIAVQGDGEITPTIAINKVKDLYNNDNSASLSIDNSIYFDSIAPQVTIERHPGGSIGSCPIVSTQIGFTNDPSINFLINFSEPIAPSTLTTSDIINTGNGGAGGLQWSITNCGDDRNFLLTTTTINGGGTIIPNIRAFTVKDPYSNGNFASTSVSNIVKYDQDVPTVAINQSPDQSDPTAAEPVRFKVSFSEEINPATFTAADITLDSASTVTVGNWTVVNTGNNQDYYVEARGLSGIGLIKVKILAGAIQDFVGFNNSPSTSVDNEVTTDRGWYQEAYIKASNPTSGDKFGSSIDFHDELLAVGAPLEDSNQVVITNGTSASADNTSADSGAVYLYRRSGTNWTQEAYLKAVNATAGDQYGYDVAVYGDTVVVSAINEDSTQTTITNGATADDSNIANDTGAVYVYRKTAGVWGQEAFIKAGNAEVSDQFGFKLAIDQDTIAVGVPADDSNQGSITNGTGSHSYLNPWYSSYGSVFIYRRTGVTWVQEAYIKASDTYYSDYFGHSISLQDNTLVVGAFGEDSSSTTVQYGTNAAGDTSYSNSGAVYVFNRTGVTWAQEAYIKTTDTYYNDQLGKYVSLYKNRIAIAAHYEDSNQTGITLGNVIVANTNTSDSGAVYLFQKIGTQWIQEAYIKPSINVSSMQFGVVSLHEDALAVGVSFDDVKSNSIINNNIISNNADAVDSGAVFTYHYFNGIWYEDGYIKPSNSDEGDEFGFDVKLFKDTLVVAAPKEDSGTNQIINSSYADLSNTMPDSGAVYVYRNKIRNFEPIRFAVTTNNENSISLSWTKIADTISGFKIAYVLGNTAPANCNTGTIIDVGNVETYVVTGLTERENYSFRICSYNSVGTLSSGLVVSSSTTDRTIELSNLYLQKRDRDAITLNWSHGAVTATGYKVAYLTGETAPNLYCSNGTVVDVGTATTYTLTSAGSTTNYSFRVCAYDGMNVNTKGRSIYVSAGWYQEAYLKANNSDASDSFGNSVKISGDSLIVGSPGEDANVNVITNGTGTSADNTISSSGAAYIYSRSGSNWVQEAYIKASNNGANDNFGNTVSIHGDTAIVSSIYEDSNQNFITNGAGSSLDNSLSSSGAVYVYRKSAGNWTQEAFVKATNNDSADYFGTQVDINGDTLIVTASGEDSNQSTITAGTSADDSLTSAGAVYVYKRSGVTWTLQAFIKASNSGSSDNFGGNPISLEGDILAVGAVNEDSNQTTITSGSVASSDNTNQSSGAVYIYKRSQNSWFESAYIKAVNNDSYDYFGSAVGVSGNTLAVGAYTESSNQNFITNGLSASENDESSSSGAVYVYELVNGLWRQQAYIKASNSDSGDNFGSNLALSGDTLAIGAPGEDSNQQTNTNSALASADNSNTNSGAVYVYKRVGSSWSEEAYLKLYGNAPYDSFGSRISISGDTIAVGVPNDSFDGTGVYQGNGYTRNTLKSYSGAVAIFRNHSRQFMPSLFGVYEDTGTDVTLRWMKSPGATGYKIAYQSGMTPPANCSTGTVVDVGDVDTYTVTGLTAIDYSFRICSYDATFGESTGYAILRAGSAVSPFPNNPSNLQVVSLGADSFQVTWTSGAGGVIGYKFNYLEGTNPPIDCVGGNTVDLGNVLSYTLTSLKNKTDYSVRICSYDGAGVMSTGAIIKTKTTEYSFDVTDLKLDSFTTTSANLSWSSAGAGGSGYKIAYAINNAPENCTLGTVIDVGNVLTFNVTGLTSGTDYGFRVCAYDASSNLTYGSTVSKRQSWNQEAYIRSINSDYGDSFGHALSLSNDLLAVSAPYEDSNVNTITNGPTASEDDSLNSSGAVYLYRRSGNFWVQEAFLKASNADNSDNYGTDISVQEDYLVVGAPFDDNSPTVIFNSSGESEDDNINESGAVYVYKKTAGLWRQEAYIKSSISNSNDRNGTSVSISGDQIAVGAPYDDYSSNIIINGPVLTDLNGTSDAGSVFVYKKLNGKWIQEALIKDYGSGSNDNFGSKVILRNDTLVVNVPGEDSDDNLILHGSSSMPSGNAANDSGAVVVFRKVNNLWTREAIIKAENSDVSDEFGASIDYFDNYLVVGAPGEDSNVSTVFNGTGSAANNLLQSSGAVFVYKRTNNLWEQKAILKPTNISAYDYFGRSVSMFGKLIAVGAPGQDGGEKGITLGSASPKTNTAGGSGAVYLFKETNNLWQQVAFIKPYNNYANNSFGSSVSLYGSSVAVGATGNSYNFKGISHANSINETWDTTNFLTSGAVYIFRNSVELFDPVNLAATPTHNSVALSWLANGDAVTGYKVAYATGFTAPADCSSGTVVDVGNVTNHTVNSLVGNTNYSFRVCSYNSSGTDSSGDIISVRTLVSPFEVSGLTLVDRTATSIELSWVHGGAPITGFKIAYSQSKVAPLDCTSGTVIDVGNVTTYNLTGLIHRKEYSIRVCGYYTGINTGGVTITVPDLGWYQEAYLKPSNNEDNNYVEEYGTVVKIDKDTIAVTAPEEAGSGVTIINGPVATPFDHSTWSSGAVYIYKRTGSNWVQEAYLKAPNAGAYLEMGWDLAMDGDRVVAASPWENSIPFVITDAPDPSRVYLGDYEESGAVYIYKRNAGVWSLEKFLKASNAIGGLEFGYALAISGNTLAVGTTQDGHDQNFITNGPIAPEIDWNLSRSGSVYVFVNDGSDWKQQSYIKASNAGNDDYFGEYIALQGNTLAVSARREDSSQNFITNGNYAPGDNSLENSGAVYLFNREGIIWRQQAFLKLPIVKEGDEFGGIMSLEADQLAVGHSSDDSNQNTITNGSSISANVDAISSGAVLIYKKKNNLWEQEAYIKAFNPEAQDYFGSSVSLSGNRLAVGATGEDSNYKDISNLDLPSDNNSSSSSGAVYVYRKVNGLWEHEAYLKAPNAEQNDYFGTSVSIDGDTLVVGASGEDSTTNSIINGIGGSDNNNGYNSGAVYVFRNNYEKYSPSRVRVASNKTKEITLRWTKRSTDAGYKVDYLMGSNAPVDCSQASAIDVGWVDTYTYTNLQPNVQYSFIICAYDGSGNLGVAQTISQKTLGPPVGPILLMANDIKVSSMLLQWENDVTGATGYRVAFKTGSIPPANCNSEINLDIGNVTSYRMTSLIAGNLYSARVCPYDSFGVVGNGATVTASTLVDVWYQESFIKTYNSEPFDEFGSTVDIYADRMVVGAPGEDSNQSTITNGIGVSNNNSLDGSGAVYVYKRTFEDWEQMAYIKSSNIDSGDLFGSKVKIHDKTIAVAAPLEDSNQSTITNGATSSSDNNLSASGAVYVYTESDSGIWSQQAYIKSPTPDIADEFGSSLSLNANTLAVGVSREDSNQSSITNGVGGSTDNSLLDSGAVFVYVRTGNNWIQEAYIKAVNNDETNLFGTSVALDGDTLAVGAAREDSNQVTITNGTTASVNNSNDSSGAVYVYKRSAGLWSQEAYIKASNNNAVDYFGSSVDIRGNLLAVGAPKEDSNELTITMGTSASSDNNATDSGAVYLYKRTGVTWVQDAYIKSPNADAEDNFGSVVKIGQDTLVVSAPNEDSDQDGVSMGASLLNDAESAGAVYVFRHNGTAWLSESYLKPAHSDANDLFGKSIAMSGDSIVVGSPGESSAVYTITNSAEASLNNDSSNSGAVYVYRYIGRKFDIVKLIAKDNLNGDIELSWNRLAFAFGYKIAYVTGSTPPANCSTGTIIDAGNVDRYTVTGLTPGQSYAFRVCGYDDAGNLSPGTTINSTRINPPPNPSSLALQADNSQQVSLSWLSGGGTTTGFKVAYKVGTVAPVNCEDGVTADVGNVLAAVVSGFQHYSRVTIRVCAYNASGTLSSGIIQTIKAEINGWYQEAYIKPHSNMDELEFGEYAISLSNNTLIVPSTNDFSGSTDIINGPNSYFDPNLQTRMWGTGAVWVFDRVGDNWSQSAYLKPFKATGDKFGYSTSISNDIIAVGAPYDDSSLTSIINGGEVALDTTRTDSGAVYIFKKSAGSWKRDAYLKPSNPLNTDAWGNSDMYGASVKVSGDTIIVAAPYEDANQNTITNGPLAPNNSSMQNSGAVYVYRDKGNGWYQEAYIKAPNPTSIDNFGYAVSFEGDTIVVGAPGEDSNQTVIVNGGAITENNANPESGAAYVYRRTGDAWAFEAYIKAVNSETGDQFGDKVSIHGDVIVVSAPSEDSTQNFITNGATASADNSWYNAGAAYVYRRSGTTWAQEAYIKLSGTAIHPEWYSYISSVDVYGDTIVLGNESDPSPQNVILNGPYPSAYGDGNNSWDVGSVYVYKKGPFGWAQEAYIQASNAFIENSFGMQVALKGDTLAVSAPYEGVASSTIINGPTSPLLNELWTYRGAVYVYRNKSRVFDAVEPKFSTTTSNSMTLNWTANAGNATGFRIVYQVGTTPPADCNSGTILNIGNVSSHNITGLLPNTNYAFRICSYDGAGNLSSGVTLVNTTVTSSPEVQDLAVKSNSTSTLSLSWVSGGGVTSGYKIAYNTATYPVDCNSGTTADVGTLTNVDLTGLTTATTYYVRVCSYDGSANLSKGKTIIGLVNSAGWNYVGKIKPDLPKNNSMFGELIKMSEDTIAVALKGDDSNQTTITSSTSTSVAAKDSGAVYIFKNNAGNWNQEAYIKAENAEASDQFGYSIDLYKGKLAVGAPFEDSNQSVITNGSTASSNNDFANSGAVYVYKRTGATWTQEAYLKANNVEEGDQYGFNVSLKNNILAVSAIKEDSEQNTITNGATVSENNNMMDSGAVYIYRFNAGNWQQEAYLKVDTPNYIDNFGYSISLNNDDALAVSSIKDDGSQSTITNGSTSTSVHTLSDSGAVYVFRRISGLWTQEAYIKPPNANSTNQFGDMVDFENDTLAISVVLDDSNSTVVTNGTTAPGFGRTDSGAVYIIRRTAGSWAQEAFIKASNNSSGFLNSFGNSIALSGDTLAVGYRLEDSNDKTITNGTSSSTDTSSSNSGAVFVYKRTGVNWAQEAYIKSPFNDPGDFFGQSVDIVNNTIIVGSPMDSGGTFNITQNTNLDSTDYRATNSGTVFIFKNNYRLFEIAELETTITSNSIALNWSNPTGLFNGVKYAYQAGTTAPADCHTGTAADLGVANNTNITGLTSSTTYTLRICTYDSVPNYSAGLIYTFTTAP